MKPYIVLVTGGRTYGDRFMVWTALDCLHWQRPITHLIHGGASGADTLADAWARDRGVQPVACPALWEKMGKAAGHHRNYRMSQLMPHCVVAFPGGSGTASMLEIAVSIGIEVREVVIDPGPLIRIVGPKFVGGICRQGIAPYLRHLGFMPGWSVRQIREHCANNGWTMELLK